MELEGARTGMQIMIRYGQFSTAQLLVQYGFGPINGPASLCSTVSVELPEADAALSADANARCCVCIHWWCCVC